MAFTLGAAGKANDHLERFKYLQLYFHSSPLSEH